uniref:Secoisolariciresinol dehydrogenase-like n=1 Tax=Nelumbo nucifera TaxID=4432 RepID=A0A822ZVC4_NELNU|nr:TPA_asm: hypothetical protein HUJ06_018387 [Nelumbo nucifera]
MANSSSILSAVARRLEAKVALVTDGASGLGRSCAKLFSQHGAKVVIADIQDELGHSVCKELGPSSASFIHCDVTNESDVENAVNGAVARHGKLDIMLINAGIIGSPTVNILANDRGDFQQVLNVNVIGPFLGTKHAARVMILANGGGSIINMASICSIIGGATPHAYTSSKHAVLGLTRNTAVELGRFGIRVNCISPYAVATPQSRKFLKLEEDAAIVDAYSNLKGVALKPEDVAEAALYLGSEDSSYVSGHNLVLDGAFTVLNQGFCMFDQSS